jgi:hypothetical protein
MMVGIIARQLAEKLYKLLDDNNGEYHVTTDWVNDWLNDNKALIETKIVGSDGQEIHGARVLIKKTGRS